MATNGKKRDLQLATAIGKAVAEELTPQFDGLRQSIGGLQDSIGGLHDSIGGLQDSIEELQESVGEIRVDIRAIKNVAVERELDTDRRLRRIEQHLNLPPLPPATPPPPQSTPPVQGSN
jgi:predicted  nucleic acid-binding Zn-ribbon protein